MTKKGPAVSIPFPPVNIKQTYNTLQHTHTQCTFTTSYSAPSSHSIIDSVIACSVTPSGSGYSYISPIRYKCGRSFTLFCPIFAFIL